MCNINFIYLMKNLYLMKIKKNINITSKMTENKAKKIFTMHIDIVGSHTKCNCIGNVFSSTFIMRQDGQFIIIDSVVFINHIKLLFLNYYKICF